MAARVKTAQANHERLRQRLAEVSWLDIWLFAGCGLFDHGGNCRCVQVAEGACVVHVANFINGRFEAARSGATLDSYNPATHRVNAVLPSRCAIISVG